MKKREANFTIVFRHWLKSNPLNGSAAFELKQTTSDSFAFRDVQPHQIDALLAAKNDALLYKAPDDTRGHKPFDLFYLHCANAYVVIKYPRLFCVIDIEKFVLESQVSKRKSLTRERAKEISRVFGTL